MWIFHSPVSIVFEYSVQFWNGAHLVDEKNACVITALFHQNLHIATFLPLFLFFFKAAKSLFSSLKSMTLLYNSFKRSVCALFIEENASVKPGIPSNVLVLACSSMWLITNFVQVIVSHTFQLPSRFFHWLHPVSSNAFFSASNKILPVTSTRLFKCIFFSFRSDSSTDFHQTLSLTLKWQKVSVKDDSSSLLVGLSVLNEKSWLAGFYFPHFWKKQRVSETKSCT